MRRPQVAWGRVTSGAGVLLAAGAVVAAGTTTSPASPAPAHGSVVGLEAGDAVLACAGPPRLLAVEGQPATDEDFDARADTETSLRAVAVGDEQPPALTLSDSSGERRVPSTGTLGVVDLPGADPAVARATPEAGGPARLAALRTALTTDGDLRGLAASACAEPVEDAWIVAGSTVVGRSSRLELVNPGPTTAVVDVTALTSAGPVAPQAAQGVSLAAGAREELLLEGLVPDAETLAVRVQASGGGVAAALVETRLSGLTPHGVETSVAATPAAQRHVLPGVPVGEGWSAPRLRLAAPGGEDAVVRWQAIGVDGPVDGPSTGAATVPAGTAVEVAVEGLAPGDYTVTVDADVPVVAAVRVTSGPAEQASDVAWSSPAQALGGRSVVALPDDVDADLHLTAPGTGGEVEVQALDSRGDVVDATSVPVGDFSVASVDLAELTGDDAVALVVSPPAGAEIVAALLLGAEAADGGRLLSVVPVRPEALPPGAVTVRTSRDGRWP